MKALLFFIFTFCALSAHSFQVRSLHLHKSTPSESLFQGKTVWILFRPNCSACLQLFKEMSCLEDLGQFRAVGFDASEKELRDESRRLENLERIQEKNMSPFYGDKELLKVLGVQKNYSPQIIIFQNQKKLSHHLGALECAKIKVLAH